MCAQFCRDTPGPTARTRAPAGPRRLCSQSHSQHSAVVHAGPRQKCAKAGTTLGPAVRVETDGNPRLGIAREFTICKSSIQRTQVHDIRRGPREPRRSDPAISPPGLATRDRSRSAIRSGNTVFNIQASSLRAIRPRVPALHAHVSVAHRRMPDPIPERCAPHHVRTDERTEAPGRHASRSSSSSLCIGHCVSSIPNLLQP